VSRALNNIDSYIRYFGNLEVLDRCNVGNATALLIKADFKGDREAPRSCDVRFFVKVDGTEQYVDATNWGTPEDMRAFFDALPRLYAYASIMGMEIPKSASTLMADYWWDMYIREQFDDPQIG
jgi:hypothetical protein